MKFTLQSGNVSGKDGTLIHYTASTPMTAVSPLTLVFCNGVGMDTSLWVHFLEFFRPRYRTLVWDYRGHGLSHRPKRVSHLKITDHVKDLKAVLDHLSMTDIVLLGHSMGVQVILEYFHRHPKGVRGLVPVCGCFENPMKSFFYTGIFDKAFPAVFNVVTRHAALLNGVWQVLSRTRLVEEIALLLGTNRTMTHREDMKLYMKNLSTIDLDFFVRALKGATQHSARKILNRINVPVLIVAGQWDPLTPLAISKEMAKRIPDAELLVIPQGSHCGLLDQPELVNLKTEKFLERLTAQTLAA